MKNASPILICLFFSFILAGCSRTANLIIVNLTSSAIHVEYTVDVLDEYEVAFIKPNKKNISFYTVDKEDKNLEPVVSITNKTLQIDTATNYVSFYLFPNELVQIGEYGNNDVKRDKFIKYNLKSFKVTTADSLTIRAEGNNVRYLFTRSVTNDKALIIE